MIYIYRLITILLYPFLIILIFLRRLFNKEDHNRYKEKIFASKFFPDRDERKQLIWFHAASIGELKSIFPLVSISIIKDSINAIICASASKFILSMSSLGI